MLRAGVSCSVCKGTSAKFLTSVFLPTAGDWQLADAMRRSVSGTRRTSRNWSSSADIRITSGQLTGALMGARSLLALETRLYAFGGRKSNIGYSSCTSPSNQAGKERCSAVRRVILFMKSTDSNVLLLIIVDRKGLRRDLQRQAA